MSEFFTYYLEANLVCIIIFGIMLGRDLLSLDKQERRIKYDHALIAFMLYFVSDVFWAAISENLIPATRFTVAIANFSNYLLMAAMTYTWLRYVMALEHIVNREKKRKQFAVLMPFLVVTLALIVLYLVNPEVLFSETLRPTPVYNLFLITTPIIYIIVILFYTYRRAKKEANAMSKRKHYYVGFHPLIVVGGGILQVTLLPRVPIFCFSCAILMLIFYIHSMEKEISVDPLTGLNNRGQLLRYMTQEQTLAKEGRRTFVVMIDANDFKAINDTYGHSEGDHALLIIASSLKKVTKNTPMPSFLGRFGGDEFILIAHPTTDDELDEVVKQIRDEIADRCMTENTPYRLTVGIGYDEFLGGQDSYQKCMQRADHKLYLDKEYIKLNEKGEKK